MFSRGCTLKFIKKRNQWENGNETCRIVCGDSGENDIYKGYSYKQVIFYFDEKLDKWVFNSAKFSPTTNHHQDELLRVLTKIKNGPHGNGKEILSGHFITLNHGFSYEKLEVDQCNIEIVKTYFPEKLQEFLKRIEDLEISKKESKARERLLNNIRNFKYKNKETFLKAVKKADYKFTWVDVSGAYKMVNLGLNYDEITSISRGPVSDIRLSDLTTVYSNAHLVKFFENAGIHLKYSSWDELDLETLKLLETLNKFSEFLESNDIDITNLGDGPRDSAIKEYLALKNLSDITESEAV